MTGPAQSITPEDIQALQVLGFVFDNLSGKTPDTFLNENFKGIELRAFLKQIDDLLAPMATPPISKRVRLAGGDPKEMLIEYKSAAGTPKRDRLMLSRIFKRYQDELIVEHHYFVLPQAHQGQGKGKKVLAACLKQYLAMDVTKIKVHSGLEVGGYVWARAGFKAIYQWQMELILKDAGKKLSGEDFFYIKKVYDTYYNANPGGAAFPIEQWARFDFMQPIMAGSDWHGEIDLTNPKEVTNFNNYVSK